MPSAATLSPTAKVATGTITDNDPTPTVAISSPTVAEGAAATFTVTLSAASDRAPPSTCRPSTAPRRRRATTPRWPIRHWRSRRATTSKTVVVNTATDTLDEANETFTLKATSATNATIPTADSGTTTITDDDASPGLSIADATATEGNTATTPVTFTVTLGFVSGQNVTVHWGTVDNTATVADSDYAAASGDLTFVPGDVSETITVNVTGDTKAENDDQFKVLLSTPVGATLTRSTATGTITNDDGTPPPPPMMITTGAGAGAGSHVRVLDPTGAAQPPEGFFPYPDGPGVRVARGDLDGDGHDEIVVASGPGRPPIVRVFTSAGAAITETLAYASSFTGGVFIAAGDVDGDGKNEVITAAGAGGGPHVRTFQPPRRRRATARSHGSDRVLTAPTRADSAGGLTVAVGQTSNGDGNDEIVVGHGVGRSARRRACGTTSPLRTRHAAHWCPTSSRTARRSSVVSPSPPATSTTTARPRS